MAIESRFKRVFKVKNPIVTFLCPLCGVERGLRYRAKLNAKNYLHIIILSVVLGLAFWPIMEYRVIYTTFAVWAIYETVHKFLFRKEIPCPHCGFDATWYKRDVRVARKMVKEFWATKNLNANAMEQLANDKGSRVEVDKGPTGEYQAPSMALMDNLADDLIQDQSSF